MSDDITPEERQRIHDERAALQRAAMKSQRTEDMKSALRETLSETWFQDSIGESVMRKLTTIFNEMRPPRKFTEVRDGIEHMLAEHDARRAHGLFLRNFATSTGRELGRFIAAEAMKAALVVGLGLLGYKVLF